MMFSSGNVIKPTPPANDKHAAPLLKVAMAPVKETAPAEKPTK